MDDDLIWGVRQAAVFWRVSVAEIYRNPKRYGGRQLRRRGRWRFPKAILYRLAGIEGSDKGK